MGMVPEGVVRFGKRLEGVERTGEGVVLRFGDGTRAEADAVVGCDGVKSSVRGFVVEGEAAECGYSGKYAYRCMIPMERAVEAIGEKRTGVSSLWVSLPRRMGKEEVGVVTLTGTDGPWPTCPHVPRGQLRARPTPQPRCVCDGLQRILAEQGCPRPHSASYERRRSARL